MPEWEEYCPEGNPARIRFRVSGDRVPVPTTPCICHTESGIGPRETLITLAHASMALGGINSSISLLEVASGLPMATSHSSKIRRVSLLSRFVRIKV